MKNVTSGIEGLDNILQGGFQEPASIIVTGLPGTGKTLFIMESVFKAASSGEKVCLFQFNNSKPIDAINNVLSRFDFFDQDLYERELIKVYRIDLTNQNDGGIQYIRNVLDEEHPSRIVVDYTALLHYGYKNQISFVSQLNDLIREKGALVYFAVNDDHSSIEDIPAARYGDEIFHLSCEAEGNMKSRYIDVIKSHQHSYTNKRFIFNILDKGIAINAPKSQDISEMVEAIDLIRRKNRNKILLGAGAIGFGLILLTVPGMIIEGYKQVYLAILGALIMTAGIYISGRVPIRNTPKQPKFDN